MHASNYVCRLLSAIGLCLTATLAQAAGLRSIDIPADADGPAIHGEVWYPCAETPGEVKIGRAILPGVQDCPLAGNQLPLIAASHGQDSTLLENHDTAETLADNGFIVAAINHPGDTAQDPSRPGDLSAFVERPSDIKRLIDFMIDVSPFAAGIDQDRIGFFGYSRGGTTGLVLIGANSEILAGKYPSHPLTHDPRIKAAVLLDPLAIFFSAESLVSIKAPVQLWASERGGDGVLLHDVAALDANLPARHEYRVVSNAWHFAFFLCPRAMVQARSELCVDAQGFDRVAFHKDFNVAVLAFFQQHLR